jgi:CHASE2 domain-containing sensor protein
MNRVVQFSRRVRILRYLGTGVLIACGLIGGKILFEKSSLGHRIEVWTYEFLQGQLTAIETDPLPVVVVDISQIPGGSAGQVTSRDQLTKLIYAIAKEQPKAIAVDGDFSPTPTGWVDPDNDPDFFDFCLKMRRDNHVPVFLGVHRTLASSPSTWLGLDEYKELAVVLLAPDDTTRLPVWIRQTNGQWKLPALSTALAEVYRGGALPQPPGWLQSVTETIGEPPSDAIRNDSGVIAVTTAIVNYSKLELIQLTTLPSISPQSVAEAGTLFRNRVVIIGKGKDATDRYNVPGRDATVAGVFLHACAAYTFIKEPLYELNTRFRLGADLFFSVAIILAVGWFRLWGGDKLPWHQRQSKYTWIAATIVFAAGVIFVRFLALLWLDFVPLILALLLHPYVEKAIDRIFRRRNQRTAGFQIRGEEL